MTKVATRRISDEVIEVLKTAECDGNKVRLTQQLERKLYQKTAKVLECLGGKWNRKEQATLFDEDAAPLIADAITAGEFVDAKKTMQQFWTPQDLGERLCRGVDTGETVLEPSAGSGVLARILRDQIGAKVECYELDVDLCGDLFDEGFVAELSDFLTVKPKAIFDHVRMNPPFSRSQDIKHVRHAYDFLKPGGTLRAIMSPGFTFRQDKIAKEFASWLDSVGGEWVEIEDGAFSQSGTMVRTVEVTIKKQ